MKEIGNLIGAYRRRQNMTEEELGQALSSSTRTVADWERGKTIPDPETLRRLSVLLGIPSDALLCGTVQAVRKTRRMLVAVIAALLCVVVIFVAAVAFEPCVKAIEHRIHLKEVEYGYLSCDDLNDVNQAAIDTTIVQLLANPEEYHGKLVRVIGVGNLAFEDDSLSLSKEDLKHGLGHSLWISLGERAIPSEEAIRYNGEYVIVEGFFDMYNTGHMGLFEGAIVDISRYQRWTFEHSVGIELLPTENVVTSESSATDAE